MSRINEYEVKGRAFKEASEAVEALNSLLEDVEATDAKCAFRVESDRQYHTNILGLQGCMEKVLEEVKPQWVEAGLDGTFALAREESGPESYTNKAVFLHPVYEHVWLTDSDGKNMAEELLPFMYMNLEYDKETNAVKFSITEVKTKLNLPELKTSLKNARQDLELVREEVERAGTVVSTALDTVFQATDAIREYCNEHQLDFETSDVSTEAAPEVGDAPVATENEKTASSFGNAAPPKAVRSETPEPKPAPKKALGKINLKKKVVFGGAK